MPYICMIRSDIPDGFLQVLDLHPNTSQRKSKGPPGQTKYVDRADTTGAGESATRPSTVSDTGGVLDYATYGLAAYLADHICDNAGTGAMITAAIANAAAVAIRDTRLDASVSCTDPNVRTILIAAGATIGVTLDTLGSTATIAQILQILSGRQYLLPNGSAIAGAPATSENGAFVAGTYRHTYNTGALKASFAEGVLSEYLDATWSYNAPDDNNTAAVAGAAVVIYTDAGAVYTG